MSEKRILMVLPESYPDDIRVSKEIDALQKADFEIHLICSKRKNEPAQEVLRDIHITRIPGAATFTQKGISDVITAFLFINPFFYLGLKKQSKRSFRAVHVHDLPLFKTTKKVFRNTPVVLDMHENYPEALKVWFAWKTNPLIRLKNKIFFGYKKWSRYEEYALKEADHVVTVVEEMKERACEIQSIDQEKFITVSNTEGSSFLNQEVDETVFDEFENKFIITYTGNVGPHRGVDTLIKSARYLKDLNIQLLIIGKSSSDTEHYLRSLIEQDNLTNVELWGYRPFNKFYSYMKQTNLNVIPHNRNGHTDHTIPHKLFQAMMCKRPVLVSDCKPLKRIVNQTQSGLVFKAGNERDAAEKIRTLFENHSLYESCSKNGYEATINGGLNWEEESKKLVTLYQSIN